MFWSLIAAACLIAIVWSFLRPGDYWTRKNVLQTKPLPIVGHQLPVVLKRMSLADLVQYVYNMFPESRYSGFYQMTIPTLVLRDPDLIKQITVKDFDHFMDHRSFVSEENEPIWGKNLFSLKGERWRHMRATLSPSFTSSKMKMMFVLMSECAENFVRHFEERVEETADGEKPLEIEMKDALTRFTNDVIATTAFGIKCNSLKETNNKFYLMGKDLTNFGGFRQTMKFFIITSAPRLSELLRVKMFSSEVTKFFTDTVLETIRVREEKGIVRPDMINILMEAKKGGTRTKPDETPMIDTGFATVEEHIKPIEEKNLSVTDTDIVAQALIFFFAGFDSVAALMAFATYELAVNPEVQERLQREIDETHEQCNGIVTYEALLKMKYLDMVLSEVLRKWPNATAIDRVCVKPYVIQPETPEEKPVHLQVGDVLWLPIYALHRDRRFYPDPEKFDPERFSDENKDTIKPYTYLPFGVGPRNCIGSRFALLETKILFYQLLRKFSIVPIEKTQIPLKLSKRSFNLVCEKGHWTGLKRRKVSN